MLTKKQKPPSRLPLSDIIRDPALAVRPVSDAVAEDYAEHLEELPAIVVWEILGKYYLADGWHRYRAHELAGAADIKVIIMAGSLEQAKLFVANCDIRVGVRRTRDAKRAAVLLVLSTEKGATWRDREVARHCGVSHTFVSLVKARLAGNVANDLEAGGDGIGIGENPDSPSSRSNGNVATEPVGTSSNAASKTAEHAVSEHGSGTGKTTQNGADRALLDEGVDPNCELDVDEPEDGRDIANTDRGTSIAAVINQISALAGACEDNHERRRVLNRLGDAILGMLDELGSTEELDYEDEDVGLTS